MQKTGVMGYYFLLTLKDKYMFRLVAAIITVADEHEAIEMANNSNFGLGAAIFTHDIKKGEYIAAKQLQACCCFVNSFVKSDPCPPFEGLNKVALEGDFPILGLKSLSMSRLYM